MRTVETDGKRADPPVEHAAGAGVEGEQGGEKTKAALGEVCVGEAGLIEVQRGPAENLRV